MAANRVAFQVDDEINKELRGVIGHEKSPYISESELLRECLKLALPQIRERLDGGIRK